ncbi:MAG: hypothetical protein KatS3mg109_1574 [Pirellulaceae bacterium]|nr:MAG: hypothetical protein KatS3mg109_1574 [Pirellulaceae bacterium]
MTFGSAVRARPGFTLVELLLALAVATLLAATLLMAMWSAQEEARDARTQAQIAKLNEYIMSQWETYSSRQVPIRYRPANPLVPFQPTARERLLARLVLLRDLMRMELPDRKTDVLSPKAQLVFRDNNGNVRGIAELSVESRAWREYRRRAVSSWTETFQGAECLYLIISTIRDENGSGLDYFRDNEIGDVDGDGMPEILDGWGNPISFLRWAPGYDSPMQIPDRNRSPDFFDPLHVDPRWSNPNEKVPFNLIPLIFSPGPDRLYGLITDTSAAPFLDYRNTTPLPVDPYAAVSPGIYVGQGDGTSDAADNITNHLIEIR